MEGTEEYYGVYKGDHRFCIKEKDESYGGMLASEWYYLSFKRGLL
jgi:hypothetical protein